MVTQTRLVLFSCMMLVVASCGSSGSTEDGAVQTAQTGMDGAQVGGGKHDASPASCRALSPAGAKLSWDVNGTPECAVVITATRVTNATQDFLEIVSGTSSGTGVGLTVVSYTSPLGGTYNCKTDGGYSSQYVDFIYVSTATLVDCTITITSPGTPGVSNAVGSFSATLTTTGGGTTAITQGNFDTPVTASKS